jgi:hypothetical protein
MAAAGRVIAALYASEERMPLSGQALIGAELAERLGALDNSPEFKNGT